MDTTGVMINNWLSFLPDIVIVVALEIAELFDTLFLHVFRVLVVAMIELLLDEVVAIVDVVIHHLAVSSLLAISSGLTIWYVIKYSGYA